MQRVFRPKRSVTTLKGKRISCEEQHRFLLRETTVPLWRNSRFHVEKREFPKTGPLWKLQVIE